MINLQQEKERKREKLTSEQTCIGFLSQPCFFKGRGFKEIICLAWYEVDNDLRWLTGFAPTMLCFVDGTTGKLAFTWPPSCPFDSEIPENGSIFWWRIWGMGRIAATFNLLLTGTKGLVIPFINPVSLSSWSSRFRAAWPPGSKPFRELSWDITDLFLLGAGGLNQIGGLPTLKVFAWASLPCFLQKKRSRSASSFSNEATANPCTLAMPSATKQR